MKGLLAATFLALAIGCATYQPVMNADRKSSISTLRVVSEISNPAIKTQIDIQYAGVINFGLAGAIVDANVNHDRAIVAEAYTDSLRGALNGIDIAQLLHDSYRENVKHIEWARVTRFETVDRIKKSALEPLVKTMEEDALIVIRSKYSLTPQHEIIELEAKVEFYGKDYVPSVSRGRGEFTPTNSTSGVLRVQSKEASPWLRKLNAKVEEINAEYNAKRVALSGPGSFKKLKEWRRSAILDAKSETKDPLLDEKQAELKRRLEMLAVEYKAEVKAAKTNAEKDEAATRYSQEASKARNELANLFMYSNAKSWLEDDSRLFKQELFEVIEGAGELLKLALNDNTSRSERESTTIELPSAIFAAGTSVSSVKGYSLNTDVAGSRAFYMVKNANQSGGYADYYSIPSNSKIYPKLNRN